MGVGGSRPPPLPTQVLSQLSHWSTAHTRKSQGQWRGQEDWEYVHQRRGAEPEKQPLPEGSGYPCTEALGCGGQRTAPSLPELLPQSDRSPTVWYGGQGEREQRLLLGPSGGQRQGPWQRGCPSIICDTLGSQLLLHPGQVGGVWVPKPGTKEK